jgi:hypothetical protein
VTESEIILTCVRILGCLPLPALQEALQELTDIEAYYRKKGEAAEVAQQKGEVLVDPKQAAAQ